MTDLAFESAGKREGLQIWRIEDFALAAVVKSQHGNFYNGDCYLILNSKRSGTGEPTVFMCDCVCFRARCVVNCHNGYDVSVLRTYL